MVPMADLTAGERLERTLAIVPWVALQAGGWATWEEICERFDLTVAQAEECLSIASMVGVAPFTPDALIDVFIETDGVSISLPDWFRRPLRPTPEQTFALLTTAKTLDALDHGRSSGAMRGAIEKVLAALGGDVTPIDVELEEEPDELLGALRRALEEHRLVDLDYYSFGRDETGHHCVEPWRVQQADGHWYLQGWSRDREAARVYRVDRILDLTTLDEGFEPPATTPDFHVFSADEAEDLVRLRLQPSSAWVLEYYPVESVERRSDGSIDVALAVGSERWLERLLLRLGPDVTVLDAPASLDGIDRRAARRLLDHYRK